MNANGKATGWFDGNLYIQNRNKFPLAELQKYAGQWVAFSTDGTRIVASHPEMLGLTQILDERCIETTDVVLSQVHADEVGLS